MDNQKLVSRLRYGLTDKLLGDREYVIQGLFKRKTLLTKTSFHDES